METEISLPARFSHIWLLRALCSSSAAWGTWVLPGISVLLLRAPAPSALRACQSSQEQRAAACLSNTPNHGDSCLSVLPSLRGAEIPVLFSPRKCAAGRCRCPLRAVPPQERQRFVSSATRGSDKDTAPPCCSNCRAKLPGLCHSLAATADLYVQLPGIKRLIINFYRSSC